MSFGITSVIARTLGAEGKGVYELAILLPIILQWVFNLGVTTASTYYVAHGDYDVTAATRGNITLSLWISVFGLLVGFMIAYFGGAYIFPGVPRFILLLSLSSLPLLYFRINLNAILQGIQDFRAYSIVELIPSVVTLTLMLLLMLFSTLTLVGVVSAFVAGNAAAAIVVIALLKQRSNSSSPLFSLSIDSDYLRQMLNYGWKSQLNIISVYLLLRIDVLLINLLGAGAASVGIYSIAVLLADRVWLISGFTARVILPRIASTEGVDADRTKLSLTIARYTFWFSLAISLGLILLGKWFIVLVYGADFQSAISALLALLPGVILFNFGVVLGADISGRGHPDVTARQGGIALLINVIANLILIPHYDYIGAGFATTLAYGYYGVIHVILFNRMTHTHWWQVCLPTADDQRYLGQLLALLRNRLKFGERVC